MIANLKTRVSHLVKAGGIPVMWEKRTGGVYDAITGSVTGGAVISYNIMAHVANYSDKQIGSGIEAGDRQMRCAAIGDFTPMEGDIVRVNNSAYRVMGIDVRHDALLVVHLRGVR